MSLQATGVTVRRGTLDLLSEVSVAAHAGELLAVVGPSGAGKSTLLAVLGGLVVPSDGSVTLDGGPVDRARVAVVLQAYGLVSVLTAAENVEIALQAAGCARPRVRTLAAAAIALVGLTRRADNLVEELSGGEQQRVALARALVVRPDVLLADEPTAELDAEGRARVLAVLRDLATAGATVVLATHDQDIAAACTHRVVLRGGRRCSDVD
ncbi:MAG: ABC transporter ATP-binding protein [Mycobacteriales bacterium]